MPEHLFLPVLLGWLFFAPSGLYVSITSVWKTPLPSVGMLRHTDHQLDHYCTECYCHPRADSDGLPPVYLIGELTLAVLTLATISLLPSPGGKQSPDHPQKSGK